MYEERELTVEQNKKIQLRFITSGSIQSVRSNGTVYLEGIQLVTKGNCLESNLREGFF